MNFKRDLEISIDATVDAISRMTGVDEIPKFIKQTKMDNVYKQYLIMRRKAETYKNVVELNKYAEISDFVVELSAMKKKLMSFIDSVEEDLRKSEEENSDELINKFHDFRSVVLESCVFDEVSTKDEYLRTILTYIALTFSFITVISDDLDAE